MRTKLFLFFAIIFSTYLFFAAPLVWASDSSSGSDLKNKQGQHKTCVELLAEIGQSTDSFYSPKAIANSKVVRMLNDQFRSRAPLLQRHIDSYLTHLHAHNEMSFQVKDPQTGQYNKFQSVPVNGIVAPIESHNFQRLVQSTEPVLQLIRRLLQKIYSCTELTIQCLGLENLPQRDAELVLKTVRESIYLEPQLKSSLMADYPFVAVAGFDGSIGDPASPKPEFFELNLGTPSGLSNNILLLSLLAKEDSRAFSILASALAKDDTFLNLKAAIEGNALKWTQMSDGITVVIGPGTYNGAHPDVAMISQLAGWPLVQASDLYEDANGWIRLNTGLSTQHPIVTGIYGRAEESYFLQSSDDGIPMINPRYVEINRELNNKMDLKLREGANYRYIYDASQKPIDVERDENGRPLLLEAWDQIGANPGSGHRGSFLKAIKNRRLYYSAIGGRVVDDKRLFRIFAEMVAREKNVDLYEDSQIARPVRSLNRSQYNLFFEQPNQFVVKEPNNSGGVGIHFVGFMSPEDKSKLVAKVRKNPDEFEIQYVSRVTTLPVADATSVGGDNTHSHVATDLRIYVFLGPENRVLAGQNSMLVRTAPVGGLYSNTSRGGGYGIGVIVHDELDEKLSLKNQLNVEPPISKSQYVPVSTQKRVDDVFEILTQFLYEYAESGPASREVYEHVLQISNYMTWYMREIMPVLDPSWVHFIQEVRNLSEAQDLIVNDAINAEKTHIINKFALKARRRLAQALKDKSQNIVTSIMRGKIQLVEKYLGVLGHENDQPQLQSANKNKIRAQSHKLKMFDYPYVSYFYSDSHVKLEMGVYEKSSDPGIQSLLDEAKRLGGEVRHLRHGIKADGVYVESRWEPPYFWVNTYDFSPHYLKPVIAIDLSTSNSLPALAHEVEHLRVWRVLYDDLRKVGHDHKTATLMAYEESQTVHNYTESERLAVNAEIASQLKYKDNPFNENQSRPCHHFQAGYVNRMTYPEFEGIRRLLFNYRSQHKSLVGPSSRRSPADLQIVERALNDPQAVEYFQKLIVAAFDGRHRAIQTLLKVRDQMKKNKKEVPDIFKTEDIEYLLYQWMSRDLVSYVILPYGVERLNSDGFEIEFISKFNQVAEQMYGKNFNRPILEQQQQ